MIMKDRKEESEEEMEGEQIKGREDEKGSV